MQSCSTPETTSYDLKNCTEPMPKIRENNARPFEIGTHFPLRIINEVDKVRDELRPWLAFYITNPIVLGLKVRVENLSERSLDYRISVCAEDQPESPSIRPGIEGKKH